MIRGGLKATQALEHRPHLLVRLGETFRTEKDGPEVAVGLGEPLAAMLTLIRSCDQPGDASFGPIGRARSVVRAGS